jgi:hypothetical protein
MKKVLKLKISGEIPFQYRLFSLIIFCYFSAAFILKDPVFVLFIFLPMFCHCLDCLQRYRYCAFDSAMGFVNHRECSCGSKVGGAVMCHSFYSGLIVNGFKY